MECSTWPRNNSALETSCRRPRSRTMAVNNSWSCNARLSGEVAGVRGSPCSVFGTRQSLGFQYYRQFNFGVGQFTGNVDADFPSLHHALPAGAGLIDGEVLEFEFGRERWRGHGDVRKLQPVQRALRSEERRVGEESRYRLTP